MSRPRVSIAGLMGVVLASGVGVAATRAASPEWAGGVLAMSLLGLGITLLGTLYRRGIRRAGWAGFAIFCGGYLVATFGPWFASEVGPHLATTRGLSAAYGRMHPVHYLELIEVFVNPSPLSSQIQSNTARLELQKLGDSEVVGLQLEAAPLNEPFVLRSVGATRDAFLRIGHGLLALVAGGLGALIARGFYRSSSDEASGRLRTASRGLMALVACGLMAIAVRFASPGMALAVATAVPTLLAVAVLGATFGGRRRAFLAGFALFGWAYLAMVSGPWFASEVGPRLPTTLGLDALERRSMPGLTSDLDRDGRPDATWLDREAPAPLDEAGRPAEVIPASRVGLQDNPERSIVLYKTLLLAPTWWTKARHFGPIRQVAQHLFALLAGLLGGLVAARFRVREDRSPASP